MPLPNFRQDGWLPDGHHSATWQEIEETFAGIPDSPRRRVYDRLILWRDSARQVGLSGKLVLNGSFISNKPDPSDFDTLFVYDEECEDILANDPAAKHLIDHAACKAAGYDLFVFAKQNTIVFPSFASLELFDRDKKTGITKGVLEVNI
ncbi:MAG: hypothetical protein IPM50_13940 [Acidobacteriota bacterium]|nr:MAG: hypothetical protein IPM50_13940 [Acidobacteriota bacterium]